jgi:UrcA family protein
MDMKISLGRIRSALLFCLLVSSPLHAGADGFVERRTVAVSLAGIELGTEEGRGILYGRLRTAAKRACRDLESRHNLSKAMLFKKCVDDALIGAIAQVRDPLFEQQYAARRLGLPDQSMSTAAR